MRHNSIGAIFLMVFMAVAMTGCSDPEKEPHVDNMPSVNINPNLSFTGTWEKRTINNEGTLDTSISFDVAADSLKYRTVRHREHFDDIKIYDGEFLYKQCIKTTADYPAAERGRLTTSQPVDKEIEGYRFWAKKIVGRKIAGGKVMGRATDLYVFGFKGEDLKKIWVDKEHGILLRMVSIAADAESIQEINFKPENFKHIPEKYRVTTTLECIKLDFGPIDNALFNRPATPE